jgi:bifunctional DNA-binding transcriptional regulator/antitoxin component of YhaV-PrlF toxin-antitoxin module
MAFGRWPHAADFNQQPPLTMSYRLMIDREVVMVAKDTATLSAKFQISLPKSIRAARCWRAGQVFAFIPKGEGMLFVPVPMIEELAGMARGAKPEDYRDRTSRV